MFQVPKPFVAARSLSSKVNGIAAAPKLVAFQKQQQQQTVAAVGLDIQCADGRTGGKLKTRKVRHYYAIEFEKEELENMFHHQCILIRKLILNLFLFQAAAKRFKVTGSGRVVVRHAGKNQ